MIFFPSMAHFYNSRIKYATKTKIPRLKQKCQYSIVNFNSCSSISAVRYIDDQADLKFIDFYNDSSQSL